MDPFRQTDQDILNGLIERRVDLLKLVQIRQEFEFGHKTELLSDWCPIRRKKTMEIYFATSDQELQEELCIIDERINHYLGKVDFKDLGDLINQPTKLEAMKLKVNQITEIKAWCIIAAMFGTIVTLYCYVPSWIHWIKVQIEIFQASDIPRNR